jgi:hypothetical protein
MREQQVRKGRMWIVVGVLLAGLAYSVLALTLTPSPVYASSCNCTEEGLEAAQVCSSHNGIRVFECPKNTGCNNGPCWLVICNDGLLFGESCSST